MTVLKYYRIICMSDCYSAIGNTYHTEYTAGRRVCAARAWQPPPAFPQPLPGSLMFSSASRARGLLFPLSRVSSQRGLSSVVCLSCVGCARLTLARIARKCAWIGLVAAVERRPARILGIGAVPVGFQTKSCVLSGSRQRGLVVPRPGQPRAARGAL